MDSPILRDELRVLASFAMVADELSFTSAAAKLGVSRSAISHSIFLLEDQVTCYLASGKLVRVLEDWCPPFDGFFLYYPSRRHQSPALQALVEALRL